MAVILIMSRYMSYIPEDRGAYIRSDEPRNYPSHRYSYLWDWGIHTGPLRDEWGRFPGEHFLL